MPVPKACLSASPLDLVPSRVLTSCLCLPRTLLSSAQAACFPRHTELTRYPAQGSAPPLSVRLFPCEAVVRPAPYTKQPIYKPGLRFPLSCSESL